MDLTITAAIAWIKADVAHYLTPQAIKSICRKFGHTWRERILDPVTTVHLFLLQVLHGNTAWSGPTKLDSGLRSCEARGSVEGDLRWPENAGFLPGNSSLARFAW